MAQSQDNIRLKFNQRHRSIQGLPEVALPPFTLLTGVNGAGKTHLLEAIQGGQVVVEGLSAGSNEIRRFDWASFSPQVPDSANPDGMRQQRENALRNLIGAKNSAREELGKLLTKYGIELPPGQTDKVNWLLSTDEATLRSVLKNRKGPGDVPGTLHRNRRQRETDFRNQATSYGSLLRQLELRAQKLRVDILSLPDSEIVDLMPLTWSQSDSLQFQIANWFAAWHGEWHYNRFDRYLATQEREPNCPYFSDDQFVRHFGPEPWDVLNDVLKAAGVRYRFNKPESSFRNLGQPFALRLIDPDDATQIQINDLSSGEKVLLAITLLLFRTSDDAALVRLPRLLLLDEVDALLHPFYAKALVENLSQKMVGTYGVKVILVTHSPSTVALAPESSVFELVRKPREIRPITKSQATQILSAGFVSVTPCDVVVITESSEDPEYYQPVSATLVQEGAVPANPPLRFLAASKPGNAGEGGGFAEVRNWAPKLHELGLERFRGLIDRDAGSTEDKVVKVIARYSMENYLYDPLLLCTFLVHRGVTKPFDGIEFKRADARALLTWSKTQLQEMLDKFLVWLSAAANFPAIADARRMSVGYSKFPDLDLPNWWIETNGHEVERLVREHVNRLGQEEKRGAGLIKADRSELISFQTRTLPESISKDLVDVFKRLQLP